MLYISFDESGRFERASKKNGQKEAVLIGGLIYDDHDQPGDYELEKNRIDKYLRAVCKHEKATMPCDLHFDVKETSDVSKRVRTQIHSTLGQFLQKGICEFEDNAGNEFSNELNDKKMMPPRKGEYHLFVYLKYGVGMENMLIRGLSNLVKDDVASNLYEHMIAEVLERMLFHNPIIGDVKEVKLDLPTRVRPIKNSSDLDHKSEYDNLGYNNKEQNSKEGELATNYIYTVADSDIYRTILEREVIRSRHQDIQINKLDVQSIPYRTDSDTKVKNAAFLFLCDLICDVHKDHTSPQAMIENIKKQLDEYTGYKQGGPEENLVFAYDEIDMIYKEALEKLEQKDYYEVLRLIYEGEHSGSPYAEFYSDVWFPFLMGKMKCENDIDSYSVALRKFYLSSRQNNLNQEELLQIYRGLESMQEKMEFWSEEDRETVLYELYDAGTSAFCHIGDSKHAEECFKKCKEYAQNVELERYLRTRDKKVVFRTDEFRFKEALDIAETNELFQDSLKDVRKQIYKRKDDYDKNYGIAMSQTGQILSFMNDRGAEQKFKDALNLIGEKGTSDYKQTTSYLLHYYLATGDQEKYDQLAPEYFGKKTTPKEQFRYIVMEGKKGRDALISMKFAIYVFIKGIYLFHMDDSYKNLKNIFEDIDKRIFEIGGEEALKQVNNHPWEITYKYLALAAKDRNAENLANTYMDKADTVLGQERGFTLDAVCLFGRLEYARKCGDNEGARNSLEQLACLFKEHDCAEYAKIDPEDIEGTYNYLKENVLGYMYS